MAFVAAPLADAQTPTPSPSPKHHRRSKNAAAATKTLPAPPTAKAPAGKTPPAPQAVQAPGGGAGQVWVNTETHVYHKEGSKWYGRTKHGQYMTEADAMKAGFHAAKNEK